MTGRINDLSGWLSTGPLRLQTETTATTVEEDPFAVDNTIESMRSQEFSVGMFYFLAFCILVFVVIVFAFMTRGRQKSLKTGEKVMFVWILLGVVAAVIFAATQMLHGYLF